LHEGNIRIRIISEWFKEAWRDEKMYVETVNKEEVIISTDIFN